MKSSTLKTFVIILIILSAIGSLFLIDVSPVAMIGSWIGIIISAFPLFALVKVLENQEDIYDKLSNVQELLLSNSKPNTNLHPVDRFIRSQNKSTSSQPTYNEWKCDKCGAVNPNTNGFCQGCGNSKEEKNDVLEEL